MTDCIGTCPACGYTADYIAFESPQVASKLHPLLSQVPRALEAPLRRYLSLHTTKSTHKLTAVKAERLLAELVPCIVSNLVEHDRHTYRTSELIWQEALAQMHDRRASFSLPLQGHGYLYRVISTLADRAERPADVCISQDGEMSPLGRAGRSAVNAADQWLKGKG